AKALTSLRPQAQWVLRGDTYEGLDWLDTEQTKPTEQELTEEATRLQAEWVATEYQRLRAPAYPAIGDQLDALFKAGVFPAEMAAKIQAVKDQFPKA
uniref:hypothetical protein n=1 Tax=Flavobacterium sp. TaxID=239 RepID=UPI0037C1698B